MFEQSVDPVMSGRPDRLIEAASPRSRGDYVPEADPMLKQPLKARLVGKRLQISANHGAEQPPELVLRMRVITPCGERRIPRQAAQNEQASVTRSDRRKPDFQFVHGRVRGHCLCGSRL